MADPSGPTNKPLALIRDALANCPAFQSWVGAGSATEAKNSIVYHEEEDFARSQRPIAALGHLGANSERPGAVRADGSALLGGTTALRLEANGDAEKSDADNLIEFENAVGPFMHSEFGAQARLAGLWLAGRPRRVIDPQIAYDETDDGEFPYGWCEYEIYWTAA